jgi:hypothetical protein
VIRDLVDDRADAETRLEHMTRVADYWRGVSGNYGFQLRSAGITPNPEDPIPPRLVVRDGAQGRRSVREMEDTLTRLHLNDDDEPPTVRRRR